MMYSDFEQWRAACLTHGLTPRQLQGFQRCEFLDDQGRVVAEWNGEAGDGPELLPTPPAAA
jgi:hypothetical protein